MKWIGMMVVLCGMLGQPCRGQLPAACMAYDRAADSLILDSLRSAFGRGKTIPSAIELQALRALSHYPELQDVAIEFRLCRQKTAHSAQPALGSLWRRATKRRYQVRISIAVPDFYTMGMQARLPYNAQIGVLGHELAHVVYYLQLGFGGMLVEGSRYGTSLRYVIQAEHATDQCAIDHHLGWQLLAWQRIARPLLEQAGRGQNYMLPSEIEAQLH